MRTLPLLILIACNGPKPDTDTEPVSDLDACDPTVLVPQPGGGAVAGADPHAETYGAAPEPYHVRYQWPARDPSRSAAFLWRTDVDTLASVIEYGVGDDLSNRVEGASFLFAGQNRIHEARLCDTLEPGTTYSYRVGGEGGWSPTYQFTTPGAPGSFDTFRVAMLGDSRGSYAALATIVELIDAEDPDFIVFSGDMVDLGPDQTDWDGWFEAAGDLLARKALVPAHGNHEFLAVNYFAQFAAPNNEEWFSHVYGDLTLVSLNDTVRDFANVEVDQVAYMDEAYGQGEGRWKLAMHHQGIYATCTTHGSYERLRELWEPVFDRNEVDLVVAGHNHIYERSKPIRGGQEAAVGEGTVYVVTGGAGAPLYTDVEAQWFGEIADPVEHYMIADFGPTGVDLVARDLSGNTIDAFTIPR